MYLKRKVSIQYCHVVCMMNEWSVTVIIPWRWNTPSKKKVQANMEAHFSPNSLALDSTASQCLPWVQLTPQLKFSLVKFWEQAHHALLSALKKPHNPTKAIGFILGFSIQCCRCCIVTVRANRLWLCCEGIARNWTVICSCLKSNHMVF